ncbi:MAG: hypothetical protein IJ542_03170 [Clostridia bacterium]|nr:hypothetical protein [Clostridia bacterium]
MIGKTIDQAKSELAKLGITEIEIINNFVREIEGSTLLVTNCKIKQKKATLTVGSFKLNKE